jgi:RNA polymerase sigma factor (sigma-70 family)
MNTDIRIVIEGCIKNNVKSEFELFKCCKPVAVRTIKKYIKEPTTVDDILQEGFIKLFKNISKYDFEGSFEGWVYRIFKNCTIDFIRKTKMTFEYYDHFEVPDVEYDYTIDEMMKDIKDEVMNLPKSYKVVTTLYYYEDLKHKEIAKKLNIHEGTSKAFLHRSKAKIIKKLKDKVYV